MAPPGGVFVHEDLGRRLTEGPDAGDPQSWGWLVGVALEGKGTYVYSAVAGQAFTDEEAGAALSAQSAA